MQTRSSPSVLGAPRGVGFLTPRTTSPSRVASFFSGTVDRTPISPRGSYATRRSRNAVVCVSAIKDGEALDRPLRVAVVGGGPAGACCAETLAQGGVETYLFERKLDNCKVRVLRKTSLCPGVRARSHVVAPFLCAWSTSSTCRRASSTGR